MFDNRLGFRVHLYGQFAAVVTAFGANGVVNVRSTAIRANGQCRRNGYVVRAAFGSSLFRMFSFRMCHFSKLLLVVITNIFQSVPAWVSLCSFCFFAYGVFVEFCHHFGVAFAIGMRMRNGYGQCYAFV